jgi:cell division protein FtsQ
MARKQQQQQNSASRGSSFRAVLRGLVAAAFASIGLVALLWGGFELEKFLIHDPQFTLAMPPDDGEESPGITVIGMTHSSRAGIARVFARDYGRSLYLLPLRQRREDLMRMPWIKDATVTRVWPNRIEIRVAERQPIAFLSLAEEEGLPLIDGEGAILLQEVKNDLKLPVLTGVSRAQSPEQRRVRARRLAKLMRDIGDLGAKISEVDASDPDNLKVMQDAGGKAVTLIIGDRAFKRRLEKFRLNGDALLRRDPDRTTFDLRFDGSIFARPTTAAMAIEGAQPIE